MNPSAEIASRKRNILGVLVDAVDYETTVTAVLDAAVEGKPLTVSALAVHGVMTGVLDSTHRYRLNHLDLVVPDGQPVRWALNLLHDAGLTDRVYGPTLMLALCERSAALGLPVYFYGSTPAVLDSLRTRLLAAFPKLSIAGLQPSKFRQLTHAEKQQTVREIAASGARLVFVGLGCPRQEVWVYEYRGTLSMPLIAVGAAFDFHAGTLPQAPPRLQQLGLEWLFRLANEPRRLWKRYVLLNPLFVALITIQRLSTHSFSPENCKAPTYELRCG